MISEINQMCDCYENDCIAISGEFNLPRINWNIPSPLYNDKYSNAFVECIMSNSLEQLVFFNTREKNKLDIVFCKNYESDPIKAVSPLVNSDHECLSFGFDVFDNYAIRSPCTTHTYNFGIAN